ncbi:MAG: ABC transporter permease subunit [Stackebrandtia sp.]
MIERRSQTVSASGQLVKIAVLGLVAALAVWAALPLVGARAWWPLAVLVGATALIFYIYLSPRRLPAKYLVPGTLLLIAFQVTPVIMTITTSVTNYGDGHRSDKDEAIAAIVAAGVQRSDDSPEYTLTVVSDDASGELAFLLTDPSTGEHLVGDAEGLEQLPDGDAEVAGGVVVDASGYTPLDNTQLVERSEEIKELAVPVGDGGIRSSGLSSAYEGASTRDYDSGCDCVTDSATDEVWHADDERGAFVDEAGRQLPQGWRVDVGVANYAKIVTDPEVRGPFLGILTWNLAFAVGSVLLTFVLGLACAIALNHDKLRGQRVYRALVILPYAMPAFAMLLVWRDMFNTDFGLINNMLGLDHNWFGETWSARASVLLVNLWLGYPYMFLISLGALQSLPKDTLEAAKLDGASGFQAFRKVTLPLLMVALTPLMIASFAFNFNNFNVVQLTTAGHPFPAGESVGGTDLLITYTYRLAFGGSGADYGYAAAVSVCIFAIVALISAISFRVTKSHEEVYR